MVRGAEIMTKRKPTTRKRRTAAKHTAWKPGWYRGLELRKRHVEQVVSFWCGLAVQVIGYGFVVLATIYALCVAYF